MQESEPQFDATSVASDWDHGADAYEEFQRLGHDYYRLEFFGPAQIEMCGAAAGLDVLDIGCGNGYLSRALAERGARVTGIDISANQIGHARAHEGAGQLGIEYRVLDAATVGETFELATFDMVTSCVSLQDMPDPAAVIDGSSAVLRPGGRFVVAMPHPCTDTPHREWVRNEAGERVALATARYFESGPIRYNWTANRMAYEWESTGWHTTIEEWFRWFHEAGFVLRDLREPRPTPAALASHPDLDDAAMVPYFLLLDWAKAPA